MVHRSVFLLLMAAILAVPLARAYSVAPIYSPDSANCSQPNSTYLVCEDGKGINIAFSISESYPDYYGTADVYAISPSNSMQPFDFYGHRCTISSGTNVCFISLASIPIFAGNGTTSEHILLSIVPVSYPQHTFYRTLNVSIKHYLGYVGGLSLAIYQHVSAYYNATNQNYSTYCGVYGMCNGTVNVHLLSIGAQLLSAYALLSNDMTQQAYMNLTRANASINSQGNIIASYMQNSHFILQNVNAANTLLHNTNSLYNNNYTILQNCAVRNVRAANQISRGINRLSTYKISYTRNGSLQYLNMSRNLSVYTKNDIQMCTSREKQGILGPAGNPSLPALGGYIIYLIMILVLGISLFYVLRRMGESNLRSSNIIWKKDGADAKEPATNDEQKDAAEGLEPHNEPESAKEEQALSPEETFDNWLNSKISKK